MNYLYLLLNILSISVPLVFSFHPKIQFQKKWKTTLPSILISGVIFIIWDILFTENGVWGFNSAYITGIHLWNLPIEEVLFFLCIPYACLFTHHVLIDTSLSKQLTQSRASIWILTLIGATSIFLTLNYTAQEYTRTNFLVLSCLIILVSIIKQLQIRQFVFTYFIVLIPFFIVNGILTGSMIESPVVWYSSDHIIGLRAGTIPVEDFGYCFSMLLLPIFIDSLFTKEKIHLE